MSVTVIETATSCADLERILDYFLCQNEPGVASRFVDAYDATLDWIGEFPELGGPWDSDVPRLQNLRVKPMLGFEKYLIFYRVSERGAYILRVFHGHQDIDSLL